MTSCLTSCLTSSHLPSGGERLAPARLLALRQRPPPLAPVPVRYPVVDHLPTAPPPPFSPPIHRSCHRLTAGSGVAHNSQPSGIVLQTGAHARCRHKSSLYCDDGAQRTERSAGFRRNFPQKQILPPSLSAASHAPGRGEGSERGFGCGLSADIRGGTHQQSTEAHVRV